MKSLCSNFTKDCIDNLKNVFVFDVVFESILHIAKVWSEPTTLQFFITWAFLNFSGHWPGFFLLWYSTWFQSKIEKTSCCGWTKNYEFFIKVGFCNKPKGEKKESCSWREQTVTFECQVKRKTKLMMRCQGENEKKKGKRQTIVHLFFLRVHFSFVIRCWKL